MRRVLNFTLSPKGGEGRVRGRAEYAFENGTALLMQCPSLILNRLALRRPLTPTLSPLGGEGGYWK
jgi:hypothetical protein